MNLIRFFFQFKTFLVLGAHPSIQVTALGRYVQQLWMFTTYLLNEFAIYFVDFNDELCRKQKLNLQVKVNFHTNVVICSPTNPSLKCSAKKPQTFYTAIVVCPSVACATHFVRPKPKKKQFKRNSSSTRRTFEAATIRIGFADIETLNRIYWRSVQVSHMHRIVEKQHNRTDYWQHRLQCGITFIDVYRSGFYCYPIIA